MRFKQIRNQTVIAEGSAYRYAISILILMQSFYSLGLAVIMAGMSGALVKSCAKHSDTVIRNADQAIPPGTGSVIRHGGKALNQDQDD